VTPALENHGGPIVTGVPSVYFIYYGQNWTAPDVNLLSTFADGLEDSTWMGMTTYQATMSTSFRFAGSSNSTYKKEGGGPLESSDILAIVRQAIKSGLPGSSSALYLVLTSQEVLVRDFCDKFCGWHSFAPLANGSKDTLKYGFVGNAAQCPNACPAQPASALGRSATYPRWTMAPLTTWISGTRRDGGCSVTL